MEAIYLNEAAYWVYGEYRAGGEMNQKRNGVRSCISG
jgi:hypothetical protein